MERQNYKFSRENLQNNHNDKIDDSTSDNLKKAKKFNGLKNESEVNGNLLTNNQGAAGIIAECSYKVMEEIFKKDNNRDSLEIEIVNDKPTDNTSDDNSSPLPIYKIQNPLEGVAMATLERDGQGKPWKDLRDKFHKVTETLEKRLLSAISSPRRSLTESHQYIEDYWFLYNEVRSRVSNSKASQIARGTTRMSDFWMNDSKENRKKGEAGRYIQELNRFSEVLGNEANTISDKASFPKKASELLQDLEQSARSLPYSPDSEMAALGFIASEDPPGELLRCYEQELKQLRKAASVQENKNRLELANILVTYYPFFSKLKYPDGKVKASKREVHHRLSWLEELDKRIAEYRERNELPKIENIKYTFKKLQSQIDKQWLPALATLSPKDSYSLIEGYIATCKEIHQRIGSSVVARRNRLLGITEKIEGKDEKADEGKEIEITEEFKNDEDFFFFRDPRKDIQAKESKLSEITKEINENAERVKVYNYSTSRKGISEDVEKYMQLLENIRKYMDSVPKADASESNNTTSPITIEKSCYSQAYKQGHSQLKTDFKKIQNDLDSKIQNDLDSKIPADEQDDLYKKAKKAFLHEWELSNSDDSTWYKPFNTRIHWNEGSLRRHFRNAQLLLAWLKEFQKQREVSPKSVENIENIENLEDLFTGSN